ncbi:MAG: hypothetical protein IEMM0008_0329 [bacterium]|nr:MAG: hypothetical protein IEMM0008_0329 [bacterium]
MKKYLVTMLLLVVVSLSANDQESRDAHSLYTKTNKTSHAEQQMPPIRLGGNLDIVTGYRDFGVDTDRETLALREVEVSLEAQVTSWLYGMLFLTRPNEESFTIEEAIAIADLPWGLRLKVGQYRSEFGLLNTIHDHRYLYHCPLRNFLVTNNLESLLLHWVAHLIWGKGIA